MNIIKINGANFFMYILIFIFSLLMIVYVSIKLSKYADLLNQKNTNISATFIGSFILSGLTSLPELFSTVSSSAIQNIDMALSNIFGSNITNLAFIGMIDIVTKQRLLKTYPIFGWDKEKIINAFFVLSNTSFLLFFLCLFHFLNIKNPVFYLLPVILNLGLYFYTVKVIFNLSNDIQQEKKSQEVNNGDITMSVKEITYKLILAGFVLLIISIILATSGDKVSQMKIGDLAIGGTFIGFLFLAFSTSLPELVSTYQSIKLGNNQMALGIIFGSNVFNLAIYSFSEISFLLSQLYYNNPSLESSLSKSQPIQMFLAIISMLMLAIIIISSIQGKDKTKPFLPFTWSSILLLVIYISSIFFIYNFRV